MNTENKEWQGYAKALKELLELEYSPVGVALLPGKPEAPEKKSRICKAILEAGKGATIKVAKENNLCFGASLHLGFHKIKDPQVRQMVNKFVVEGEKLFCSYEALENLMAQMDEVPDSSGAYFLLSALEQMDAPPQVVIFIVNAEAACRLLTFVTFFDGSMPKIKIGGPTCRLSIMYPLTTGEANISFYDYTARKMCNVEKDKLLVSLPYPLIPKIIAAIETCSGGRAKVEFPAEFRAFLQQRLASPA